MELRDLAVAGSDLHGLAIVQALSFKIGGSWGQIHAITLVGAFITEILHITRSYISRKKLSRGFSRRI